MNDEVGSISKAAVLAQFKYYSRNFLKGLREITETPIQNNLSIRSQDCYHYGSLLGIKAVSVVPL
jgi:hypothetical protein